MYPVPPEVSYSWFPGVGRVIALSEPHVGWYLLAKSDGEPSGYASSPIAMTTFGLAARTRFPVDIASACDVAPPSAISPDAMMTVLLSALALVASTVLTAPAD